MPRKLKTYITNLGFFELALAAPSMKAALEAWGMGHNAFHQGFAKETRDARIVAATMAKPGIVLRRPVGSSGDFQESAELPRQLWPLTLPKAAPPKPKHRAIPRTKAKGATERKSNPAAILSFEKARQRRDLERQKAEAKENARRDKERAETDRAAAKAQNALNRARARHEDKIAGLARERNALDRRTTAEDARWQAQRAKLADAEERTRR